MLTEKKDYSHVYWIGGSPCSGKSTIAEKLAKDYSCTYYQCDLFNEKHVSICHPSEHPTMSRLKDMSWNALWSRPVEQQVEEELEFYREEFGMIMDDVSALPDTSPIIVEGAALLPEKVEHLVPSPHHAIWIVPVPAFQKEHYAKREWIHEILVSCDDPGAAFRNWMDRDIGFARYVAKDALDRGFKVMFVDGSRSVRENYEEVRRHFMLCKQQGIQ
ncbi:hypothetical protein MHI43_19085 [Paenibacillus sp. FSL H8-0457]|nr:hypothetical protein [Paenibacillus lautus]ETT66154.1 hypothetical protein C172_09099 [Paenibacillus sp. FSL H8-457]